jgi:hypothetical protein
MFTYFSGVIGGNDGKMVLFCVGFYETLVEWETSRGFLRDMVEVIGGG